MIKMEESPHLLFSYLSELSWEEEKSIVHWKQNGQMKIWEDRTKVHGGSSFCAHLWVCLHRRQKNLPVNLQKFWPITWRKFCLFGRIFKHFLVVKTESVFGMKKYPSYVDFVTIWCADVCVKLMNFISGWTNFKLITSVLVSFLEGPGYRLFYFSKAVFVGKKLIMPFLECLSVTLLPNVKVNPSQKMALLPLQNPPPFSSLSVYEREDEWGPSPRESKAFPGPSNVTSSLLRPARKKALFIQLLSDRNSNDNKELKKYCEWNILEVILFQRVLAFVWFLEEMCN